MKGAARARRRWMGDRRCFSPTGLRQRVLEPQGKLTLLKIRGVRVLPASIFAIGTKKGSAGPWQPLRPVATPSGDSAYPLLASFAKASSPTPA